MTKYVIKRLLQSIPIFFGITMLSYALMAATPGGPVKALAFNQRLKPGEIKELEFKLGVNDSIAIQYLRWLLGDDWMRWDSDGDELADQSVFFVDLYAPRYNINTGIPLLDDDGNPIIEALPPGENYGILRGDFGRSFAERRPAMDVLVERLPATLELGLTSLLVGILLGILIGAIAAIKHGQTFDQTSRIGAVIVNAVPNFWLGLILILFFGTSLPSFLEGIGLGNGKPILPLGDRCGMTLLATCPPIFERLEYLILPTIVLSAGTIAVFSRFMRASMLDVVNQDYIRTARAKGLTENAVWWKHGMRNSMIPIATFLGPAITFVLSGAAVTERVFTWPGVGRTAVEAVTQRDFPVIMIVVIYTSLATIIGYLLSDILYAVIDPRIRFT